MRHNRDVDARVKLHRMLGDITKSLAGTDWESHPPPGGHRPRRPTKQPLEAECWRQGYWTSGWRGESGELHCPACGALIGMATSITTDVHIEGAPRTDDAWEETRHPGIGVRIRLAAGFVNAGDRHPTGPRWFRLGNRRPTSPPRVRLPAIVKCACGQDVLLRAVGEDTRDYAIADADKRAQKAMDDSIEEAGDRWAQSEVDRRLGK